MLGSLSISTDISIAVSRAEENRHDEVEIAELGIGQAAPRVEQRWTVQFLIVSMFNEDSVARQSVHRRCQSPEIIGVSSSRQGKSAKGVR